MAWELATVVYSSELTAAVLTGESLLCVLCWQERASLTALLCCAVCWHLLSQHTLTLCVVRCVRVRVCVIFHTESIVSTGFYPGKLRVKRIRMYMCSVQSVLYSTCFRIITCFWSSLFSSLKLTAHSLEESNSSSSPLIHYLCMIWIASGISKSLLESI